MNLQYKLPDLNHWDCSVFNCENRALGNYLSSSNRTLTYGRLLVFKGSLCLGLGI